MAAAAIGVSTYLPFGVVGEAPIVPALTVSRTLTKNDAGRVLVSPAGAITLTIPATLPLGFSCLVVQGGAGQVTFAAGAGVTLSNVATQTKTSAQFAVVQVFQYVSNTSYVLAGSTGA